MNRAILYSRTMSDDNPKLWVTFRVEDHYPTGEEMERVSEHLNATFGDEYDILVTTADLEPIDADDARQIADNLIMALEDSDE